MASESEFQTSVDTIIQEAKNLKSSTLDLSGIVQSGINTVTLELDRKLTVIPDDVFDLKQLRVLNLSNHAISKIPDRIIELEQLEVLKLNSNKLLEIPPILKKFKNLTILELNYNNIEVLPDWITELQQLNTLGIAGIPIGIFPKQILELYNLTNLNLQDIKISFVPSSIRLLKKLQSLSLGFNELNRFPRTVLRLNSLEHLYLSKCNINTLPSSISELTNLKTLQLLGNNLKTLPPNIVNLRNLKNLNLSSNCFEYIPDVLYEIKSLTHLDFSNFLGLKEFLPNQNKITQVSPKILKLENLEGLDLRENSTITPPPEIVEQGLDAIKNYFRQIEEQGKDYLYEAKLLIVGEGGAGKTTLARKILDNNYELITEEKSTEGIEVTKFNCKTDTGKDFRINIWDFGGQEIYHATHQFFLTKRSLYILVADTRKEDTDFYYWLNVVELLSDNSPLLIVKNEKQDRYREINERQLRGQFTNFKETLSTNLATNRGLDEVITKIKHFVSSLPHIGTPLPKTWVKVREKLESHPANYISVSEYLDICQENGFSNKEDKLRLLEYLHDLGVCLHFAEDPLLKKVVILKPKWGTDAVYKVLDNKTVIDNLGRFNKNDLEQIWHERVYEDMQDELLQLMINFKLCYKIPESNLYIAPQLLSENQCTYEWNETDNLIVRYKYDFMPKGIITQLIVSMHQMIVDQNKVWKSGVVLQKENAKIEIIEFYSKREIRIRAFGSIKKELISIVTYELDKINSTYKRLKVDKLIPCNCDTCKNNQEPHFFREERLIRFLKDKQEKIQCQESYQMVNVSELIGYTFSMTVEMYEEIFSRLIFQDNRRQIIVQDGGRLEHSEIAFNQQNIIGSRIQTAESIENIEQRSQAGNLTIQNNKSGDNIVANTRNENIKVKSAWGNGLFYLFTFAVVMAGLGVLSNSVSPYTLPMILIAGIIFVPTIGALQLRQDERLSEKSFIELMKLTTKQLPLIGSLRKQIEPPADK